MEFEFIIQFYGGEKTSEHRKLFSGVNVGVIRLSYKPLCLFRIHHVVICSILVFSASSKTYIFTFCCCCD